MSTWSCPYCPETFDSMSAWKLHIADKHNSYAKKEKGKPPELKDLVIDTIERLRSTKKQVHFLLEAKPGTRGDDWLLLLEHLKYFQHFMIYTPETQRINFKDPNGVSYEDFKKLIGFDSIRRCRQKIDEQDFEHFHDPESGATIKEHNCLLATNRILIRRKRRADAIKSNVKYL